MVAELPGMVVKASLSDREMQGGKTGRTCPDRLRKSLIINEVFCGEGGISSGFVRFWRTGELAKDEGPRTKESRMTKLPRGEFGGLLNGDVPFMVGD
jgi:hypothetical protein